MKKSVAKKLLTLLMMLLMVVGLAACGDNSTDSDLTPYEIVDQASQKLADADGVAYDLTMSIKMSDPEDAENSFEMAMGGDIKMEKVADNDYKFGYHMLTDMSALLDDESGEDSTYAIDMYYTDGYMYYDMSDMGITYKVAMDMSEAMEYVNSSAISDIEADMVKEQSMKADGTGKVVSMLLDGSKMTDMVKNMSEEFAALGDDSTMTIKDIPYVVYINDKGDITNIDMIMDFSMAVEGMEMNMSMDMQMSVEQIGGVKVELPDNLADYPEMEL